MRKGVWLIAIALAGCTTPDNGTDGGGGDLSRRGDGGGVCAQQCGGLTPFCNDAGHCVGCRADSDCPIGQMCHVASPSQASCQPGCTDDSRCGGGKCCGNVCVDPSSDPANCGGCGTMCSGPHSTGACTAAKCGAPSCEPGWGDCNGNSADGCEANLRVDPANCTACGMACALANAVEACANGCYLAACRFGFDDCDVNEANGCETPVLTDPNNCGKCGALCNALPHAAASCIQGNCALGACDPGFFDCNRNPQDGCEADLMNDPANCSGCNMPCPNNLPFCGNGVCGAQPTGCFRTTDVQQMGVTLGQYTSCEMVTNNGFTCVNPLIRYGNVPDGVPAMHVNDDFPTWCKQLGCKGYVANSVQYGTRSFLAPFGKLFWCTGYDEAAPKWCDWQDGTWYNQQLDYHTASNDAITSITCN